MRLESGWKANDFQIKRICTRFTANNRFDEANNSWAFPGLRSISLYALHRYIYFRGRFNLNSPNWLSVSLSFDFLSSTVSLSSSSLTIIKSFLFCIASVQNNWSQWIIYMCMVLDNIPKGFFLVPFIRLSISYSVVFPAGFVAFDERGHFSIHSIQTSYIFRSYSLLAERTERRHDGIYYSTMTI